MGHKSFPHELVEPELRAGRTANEKARVTLRQQLVERGLRRFVSSQGLEVSNAPSTVDRPLSREQRDRRQAPRLGPRIPAVGDAIEKRLVGLRSFNPL